MPRPKSCPNPLENKYKFPRDIFNGKGFVGNGISCYIVMKEKLDNVAQQLLNIDGQNQDFVNLVNMVYQYVEKYTTLYQKDPSLVNMEQLAKIQNILFSDKYVQYFFTTNEDTIRNDLRQQEADQKAADHAAKIQSIKDKLRRPMQVLAAIVLTAGITLGVNQCHNNNLPNEQTPAIGQPQPEMSR